MKLRTFLLFLVSSIFLLASCGSDKPTEQPSAFGSIRGKVFDSTGATPVQGATVSTNPLSGSVLSGSDGSYLIENVVPKPYAVTATKTGVGTGSVSVTVNAGVNSSADIILFSEQSKKGSVHGIVTDKATGKPIEKALVITIPATLTVETSVSGEFIIPNIDPGVYFVTVSKPQYSAVSASVNITVAHISNVTIELSSIGKEGLILYLPFNGNVIDSSGNGNDGVNTGAIFIADRHNNANSALNFDDQSVITIDHKAALDSFPKSLCFWMRSKQFVDGQVHLILGKYIVPEGNGFMAWFEKGALSVGYFSSNFSNFVRLDSQYPSDTAWHFVVFTIDSSAGKLFIDGALATSSNWQGVPKQASSSINMKIGFVSQSSGTQSVHFLGSLDDIRLYNRVLTDNEIQLLFKE